MKNYKFKFFYLLFSIFTINIYSQNVGINTTNPKATLDVNGGAIFRGVNSNVLVGLPQAAVEYYFGRNDLNLIPIGVSKTDIAFNWGGPGGGFRHYLTTRHHGAIDSPNNAFDFYLNNTNLQFDNPTGNSPDFSITAVGNKLYGKKYLEFGAGSIKENNAGKIGYQLFSNGLDIVGAGEIQAFRRITMFGEGAINMVGKVGIGTLNVPHEKLYVNGNAKIETDLLLGGNSTILGKSNVLNKLAVGTIATPIESFYVLGTAKIDGNTTIVGNTTLVGNATVQSDLTVQGKLNVGYGYNSQDFSLASETRVTMVLPCPNGSFILSGGGGYQDTNGKVNDIFIHYNGPDSNNPTTTWKMIVSNLSNTSTNIRMYCICARVN